MSWVCIDFGTCNTAAAIEIDGLAHLVTYGNDQCFPTIACVLDDGVIEVCQNAEPYRQTNPETFKQEFKLSIAENINIHNVSYTDIVSSILRFVKGCAEIENNSNTIDNVLLTVPAIYTEADNRKAVMFNAARNAGFRHIEFIPEPQAAAYHYADIMGASNTGISLIYDLGGGTFDPTLLDMTSGQPRIIGCSAGIRCGGQFFDKAIYSHISSIARETNKPLSRDKKLEDYAACKRLKESLSINDNTAQVFSNGERYSLSRTKFNELIDPLISLTLQSCDNLLSTANKSWSDVNQILFVGGSTAIPIIRERLSMHLQSHNAPDVKIVRNTNSDHGEYNHRFATCLGGIAKMILPPPPQSEKVASLYCNGKCLQLKLGETTFGRGADMDFQFPDPTMSNHHFTITVSKAPDGKLCYTIVTKSQTKATVINNITPLDIRYTPITDISAFLMDEDTITAGKTVFKFQKP